MRLGDGGVGTGAGGKGDISMGIVGIPAGGGTAGSDSMGVNR